jgi:hypothetical protein
VSSSVSLVRAIAATRVTKVISFAVALFQLGLEVKADVSKISSSRFK